jgi:two-component system sensor kinase FixL
LSNVRFPPIADIQPPQIQQVLLNLIRNAVQAMNGCVTRRLEIASRRRHDQMIEVIISDSGAGLSAKVGERMFHPDADGRW